MVWCSETTFCSLSTTTGFSCEQTPVTVTRVRQQKGGLRWDRQEARGAPGMVAVAFVHPGSPPSPQPLPCTGPCGNLSCQSTSCLVSWHGLSHQPPTVSHTPESGSRWPWYRIPLPPISIPEPALLASGDVSWMPSALPAPGPRLSLPHWASCGHLLCLLLAQIPPFLDRSAPFLKFPGSRHTALSKGASSPFSSVLVWTMNCKGLL